MDLGSGQEVICNPVGHHLQPPIGIVARQYVGSVQNTTVPVTNGSHGVGLTDAWGDGFARARDLAVATRRGPVVDQFQITRNITTGQIVVAGVFAPRSIGHGTAVDPAAAYPCAGNPSTSRRLGCRQPKPSGLFRRIE